MHKTMRDTFFDCLYAAMSTNDAIYLVTADFGAPMLDKIRESFPKRAINVGIAEQNAINVAVGLSLEGKVVYVYGIATFISMRPFEQLRINVSALSTLRDLNINIISVGAGVSYSVSGPTHHCLEDLGLMKTLPNFALFSPSDSVLVGEYFPQTLARNHPKYLRFDAHNLPNLDFVMEDFSDGFRVLEGDRKVGIITTGYMAHKAVCLHQDYGCSLIDMYSLTHYNREKLLHYLESFTSLITLEEGFSNSGGLDSEINFHIKHKPIINLGFPRAYTFAIGDREFIHTLNGLGLDALRRVVQGLVH